MKAHFLLFTLVFLFPVLNAHTQDSPFSKPSVSVGLVVSNLEQSLDFYINTIGMVKTGGFDINADFGKKSGLSDGVPFSVTILKLENSDQAGEWKVVSFNKKIKHRKPKHVQDDLGMQYITIFVNHLQPIIDRLKQKGVKFLGETPIELAKDRHFALVQDPDGNFLELIGPM